MSRLVSRTSQSYRIGYARVSSLDNRQDLGLAVQLEALAFCEVVFVDKESGFVDHRPELQKALRLAKRLRRQGQEVTFVIYKLDRLTRRMSTLGELLEAFNQQGIVLRSLQEALETNSLTGRLICLILAYVAEMELENIRLRTREGLRKAKEKGVKLGNKGLSSQEEERIVEAYLTSDKTLRKLSQELSVSTATIYAVLKRKKIRLNRRQ